MAEPNRIEQEYQQAKDSFAAFGVDTENALAQLSKTPLSLHCWQGDDVGGFERPGSSLSGGGVMVTGAHPGRARTITELRADLDTAFACIPGSHRLNLHAIYGEFGVSTVSRDALEISHFTGWIDWAAQRRLPLDFNATCFGSPLAASGFTLSNREASIRQFWIDHVQQCRSIAAYMGKAQQSPCMHNLWIPDGAKDETIDRQGYIYRLKESLDAIYAIHHDPATLKDAVESKLFGIGSESFVVGSHEFYLGYALQNTLTICLDMGHFHPTESVADKIPALLQFYPELLCHISRGMRWDSDHVATTTDELQRLMQTIVRCNAQKRTHLALDYFDGSINRIGAWVSGARTALRSLLAALLEPSALLRAYEEEGNNFGRLALLEEYKNLPIGAVWNFFCQKQGVPVGREWINQLVAHEKRVLIHRTTE